VRVGSGLTGLGGSANLDLAVRGFLGTAGESGRWSQLNGTELYRKIAPHLVVTEYLHGDRLQGAGGAHQLSFKLSPRSGASRR
jgi:hypothetical protein